MEQSHKGHYRLIGQLKKLNLNEVNGLRIFDSNTLIPVLYNEVSEGVVSLSSALSAYLFNMVLVSIAGEIGVASFIAINYAG